MKGKVSSWVGRGPKPSGCGEAGGKLMGLTRKCFLAFDEEDMWLLRTDVLSTIPIFTETAGML